MKNKFFSCRFSREFCGKKKYRAQKTSRAENDDHKSYHANEGTSISVCIYCE